jgi:hypothetical protein
LIALDSTLQRFSCPDDILTPQPARRMVCATLL